MKTNTSLDASPVHLLHRAGQRAAEIFDSAIGGKGLTPRQFAILLALSENEGVSQTDLVERTGIDRSTLADVVRRMIKKGLVLRRRTKEDQRAYAVRLSEKGRQALSDTVAAANSADQRVLGALPADKRKLFLESLALIASAEIQRAA
ncbi:MAG: MarR family transcriptional regulator [Hyphomicrobiaceae bacterium]